MKKITIALFLAAGALSLLGCNNHYPPKEQPLQPMQQSYQGILPCADCSGLETSLFLDEDGTFILQETYRGARDGDQTFASFGKWARTADKLVLTESNGEKRYFHPEGKDLRMLDRSGAPIVSKLNYVLSPVTKSLPKTPMPLTGLYTYMADAAVFQDCATGKTFPVANNIALEQGYMQARRAPGEPVFLMLNGHFSVQPSMEDGRTEKALVPEPGGSIKFDNTKGCGN
ncbi:copper homeostasis protein (lipoprotein) [Serratia fonticola]|uniref:Copper homeostasis protein (Lipoprotein) n=1 Tax=Serratia fonticola TaxID=47917 RepID=A0A559T7K4_SERFO|nr:envelope stress response activation lipoprotein NlpE [Serratia fonticola]TQI81885.1 copper homeostasis protein (lipoprotein) [Serratia fonticola]TQI96092.1 copper homeostasis protein (lipoprotein) [Serratia fonticola]TVZ70589.1 copper homeostasis protein (lipoprotein) [Serratia fonticola]